MSIHSLSEELGSYLNALSCRVIYFPILTKNVPLSHVIIVRECPQNTITNTLSPNFPHHSPRHTHTHFPNTPIIYDKRVLNLGVKTTV